MTHPKARPAINAPAELNKETRQTLAEGMAMGAVIEAGRLAPKFTSQVEQAVMHGRGPLEMAVPFGTMFGLALTMLEAQAYSPTASKVDLRNALREAQADLDRLFAHVNADLAPVDEIVAMLASAGIDAQLTDLGNIKATNALVTLDEQGRAIVVGDSRACMEVLLGRLAPVSAVVLRLLQSGLGAACLRPDLQSQAIRVTGNDMDCTLIVEGNQARNAMSRSPLPQVVVDALAAEGITVEDAK